VPLSNGGGEMGGGDPVNDNRLSKGDTVGKIFFLAKYSDLKNCEVPMSK
jgi:hypothetical protein